MPKPRQSLTLTLLQAREAAMGFFRPSLNQHGLTEQQWRVIRILSQHDELEINRLAELACILKPSMTGVLVRMEAAGMVVRRKAEQDQRGTGAPGTARAGELRLDEPEHGRELPAFAGEVGGGKAADLAGVAQ